jgi:hypothetical protein
MATILITADATTVLRTRAQALLHRSLGLRLPHPQCTFPIMIQTADQCTEIL